MKGFDIFTSTSGVVRIHFWTNPRTQVFWENPFFSICGAPKNIFWPQKPYLALKSPTFGGVILLQLFDPSNGLEVGNVQTSHFWAKSNLQKTSKKSVFWQYLTDNHKVNPNFTTYINYSCNIDDILNQSSQHWTKNLIFQKDCWSWLVKNIILIDFL